MKLYFVTILMVWLQMLAPNCLGKDKATSLTLDDGLRAFYQSNWKQASNIFNDLQKYTPNDPKPYFFSAMIPFWQYFYGEMGSEAGKQFLRLSDQAIKVSEQRLNKYPKDTSAVLILSGLHGYRSLVASREKQYSKAIKSGVTGFTYTRQVLKMDDENDEALMGKGIYQYIMGSIPKEGKWLMNLMGMQGNKQRGLNDLEKAAKSPRYTNVEAKMMLVYLYHREKRYLDALSVSTSLIKTYPDNIIFLYHHAKTLELSGRKAEALMAYRRITTIPTELSTLQTISREKLKSLVP